jgi:hypothetical protein
MPSVATSPAIASGVSAANVVATIEVPASHQGRERPATKNSSLERPARREWARPYASIAARKMATTQ